MPGLPVHHQLLEFTQTHVHWVGDAIQPSHPLSSSSAPDFNLSQHQGLFQWISSSHQWPKYWSFSLSISPSNEFLGLISPPCSPRDSQESFPTPQLKSISSLVLSFLYSPTLTYMTTGETIALTRWTSVGKAMSLLFNMLSRFAITFLPSSKCLLISWLQHHVQWLWSSRK